MKNKVFGVNSMPPANSSMRKKHMGVIKSYIENSLGLKNRVTKGKINASGKHILKPDWTTGFLEYEPNPDAAVHEVAHVFLAPMGMSLGDIQKEMDAQFGFSQSRYGYMQQKRTVFEVLPMAMEQKIRRLMGLPASTKFVKVNPSDKPRLGVDTGLPIAVRVGNKDLIRCSKNLDVKCLERLDMILNGEIKFCKVKGWHECQSIDAKINRRAKLKKQEIKHATIVKVAA
jgi:hypothetical protein